MNLEKQRKLEQETLDSLNGLGWKYIHMGVVRNIFAILCKNFTAKMLRHTLEEAITEREAERAVALMYLRNNYGGENGSTENT